MNSLSLKIYIKSDKKKQNLDFQMTPSLKIIGKRAYADVHNLDILNSSFLFKTRVLSTVSERDFLPEFASGQSL